MKKKEGLEFDKTGLDFLFQVSKILNSRGDLILKINRILIMLAEVFGIRNGMFLMRDTVTNKYNLELSPELTEEEQIKANFLLDQTLTRYPQKFNYPMVLYPYEISTLPLLMPRELEKILVSFVSLPIMGAERNIPPGILFFFLTRGETAQSQIKILNILSEIIGLSLESHGFRLPKVYEAPTKNFPMILDGIVGKSETLQVVAEVISKTSTSRAAVLIRGESGTGKELIAKAIHKSSLRSSGPFIGVNCAALTESLLASELFGHEKGAFTGAVASKRGRFELADGGTLFLDEIGDTSLSFQAKLLRVLQEGEFERLGGVKTLKVDVRIICATNVDLEEAILEGHFREDLYYRLNVVPIEVPSLRERREDIPLLVNFFLNKLNEEYNKAIVVSQEDILMLQGLDWAGNVRELENVVHRGFLMAQEGMLRIKPIISRKKSAGKTGADSKWKKDDSRQYPEVKLSIQNEERESIQKILEEVNGIQVNAAKRLGISVRQLRYRIKKYNIPVRKIKV